MRCHTNALDKQLVGLNDMDDPPLLVQSTGSVPLPLTTKRLVPKAFDCPKAFRPGQHGDVLPFLVSLQDIDRYAPGRELLVGLAMLKDLPPTPFLPRPNIVGQARCCADAWRGCRRSAERATVLRVWRRLLRALTRTGVPTPLDARWRSTSRENHFPQYRLQSGARLKSFPGAVLASGQCTSRSW